MIKILLLDSDEPVRRELRRVLGREPGFQVVGDTGDGAEALEIVEALRPDILVLDPDLETGPGIEIIRQAVRISPGTGPVVFSKLGGRQRVSEAMEAGARAYVLKQTDLRELTDAASEVAAGRRYLGTPLSEIAIDSYILQASLRLTGPFTGREHAIFQLTAEGYSVPEIARRLGVSQRMVKTKRSYIMRKLGLGTPSGAEARYAVCHGTFPVMEQSIYGRLNSAVTV